MTETSFTVTGFVLNGKTDQEPQTMKTDWHLFSLFLFQMYLL